MHLFSVSGTEPNGLDDEYVVMSKQNEYSVRIYHRLCPGEKIYNWMSRLNDDFLSFKVKGFTEFVGDLTVQVEIIDYRIDGVRKKMVDKTEMIIFKSKIKNLLKEDLIFCSVDKFYVLVINDSKFLLPEKPKKFQPEFMIYTGKAGFDSLRESSYLFNDDEDDDLLSYQSLLRTNRFR